MKLDDELLSRAAQIVYEREMAALSHEDLAPEHVFSEKFEQEMKELIDKLDRGEIKQLTPPMGWRYYVRNGIAAVLITFFLTCMVAPDVVEAAYQKLVEIIETVVTEYTDFQYDSYKNTEAEFKPVTFNYLPKEFDLEYSIIKEDMYRVNYRHNENYIYLVQYILTEFDKMHHRLNTEDSELEIRYIAQDEVRFILKDGVYRYTWVHEIYLIKGQSTLPVDEIMKILENITFE